MSAAETEGWSRKLGGPGVGALHPDWRAAWGKTITGPALRAELEANPRLQSRLLTRIGAANGVALSANPKLGPVASTVLGAIRTDRVGFVRLCGLAHLGRRIATATNRDDYAALARAFGTKPLAIAARIATGLDDIGVDHGYDSEQLVPVVDRTGRAVLRAWAETLPRASRDWMTMLLPKPKGEPATVGTGRAVLIVEGAAERWDSAPAPAVLADRAARTGRAA